MLVASHVRAEVVWRGHFEDGTLAEFARYHAVEAHPPRINVEPKPVADGLNTTGEFAARVEVRTGDDARKLSPENGQQIGSNDYNERAEINVPTDVLGHTYFREGDDVWISWQAMFPSDGWWGLDPKGGGTIFFQIHHVRTSNESYDGSPPLMFTADNDTLRVVQCLAYLCPQSATHYSEPIAFDHWYTFVLRAKHSSDPANGKLELWIDGQQVLDEQAALLFGDDFGNYILTGQYRRPNTAHDSVLFIDNYVIGTTREDVMPVDEQPPVEQPPVEEQPAEEQPAEEQPVEEPPVEEPPVDEPPVEDISELPRDLGGLRFEPNRGGCTQVGLGMLALLGFAGLLRSGRGRRR